VKITGRTESKDVKININIISLVKTESRLNVDSSITIEKDSSNASGDISQENIFL
jgi:hypothetical protein